MTAREEHQTEQRALLLEKFRPYLLQIAHRHAGEEFGGRLGISDVVQSAIFGAYQNFEDCRAKTEPQFKAWLRQILVNDILNKFRMLKRSKRDVRLDQPISTPDRIEGDAETPSQHIVAEEEKQRLESAMKQLSPLDQDVIRLRNRDKCEFREIANRLNRSPDAARMLWMRAIEKLSKLLKD